MKRGVWVPVLFMLSGCVNPSVQRHQDDAGVPKLVKGVDPETDTLRMLEDGYSREGFSYLNVASADCSEALGPARAVHADIVIVYTSKADDRSDCVASHWVKLKPAILGVHMEDLTAELRGKSGPGAYVTAVVRDSPAARAGIVRGDIIRKIGDVHVDSAAALYDAAERLAGRKVIVEIWRDNRTIEKEVQLDKRLER